MDPSTDFTADRPEPGLDGGKIIRWPLWDRPALRRLPWTSPAQCARSATVR